MDEAELPVWSLARSGRLDVLEKQVQRRMANVTALKQYLSTVEPCSGYNALHQAVDTRQTDVLRYLLTDCKMEVDPLNKFRRTPLHMAANSGMLDVAQLLLAHDADPTATDAWGVTPLYLAQYNRHYETAIILIEKDDNTIDANTNVQQLFFEAVKLARIDAVKILLARGADILLSDKRGYTGLQIAETAEAPNEKLIRLLKQQRTRYIGIERAVRDTQTDGAVRAQPVLRSTPFVPFSTRPVDLTDAEPPQQLSDEPATFDDEGIDIAHTHGTPDLHGPGLDEDVTQQQDRAVGAKERVPMLA